jgi:hypothetical protein
VRSGSRNGSMARATLEDVFIHLMGRARDNAPGA